MPSHQERVRANYTKPAEPLSELAALREACSIELAALLVTRGDDTENWFPSGTPKNTWAEDIDERIERLERVLGPC